MKTVFSKQKYVELYGISNYVENQEMVNRCDGLTGKEILKLGYKLYTSCMVEIEEKEKNDEKGRC